MLIAVDGKMKDESKKFCDGDDEQWTDQMMNGKQSCPLTNRTAIVKKVDRNPNHDVQIPQVRICCKFPFVDIPNPNPHPSPNPYQKRETIPLCRHGLGGCACHDQHYLCSSSAMVAAMTLPPPPLALNAAKTRSIHWWSRFT
jgi:hypothetical protein